MSRRSWLMGVPVTAQRCTACKWAAMAEAGRSGLSHIWASSRHTRHQRSRVRAVGITCSSGLKSNTQQGSGGGPCAELGAGRVRGL